MNRVLTVFLSFPYSVELSNCCRNKLKLCLYQCPPVNFWCQQNAPGSLFATGVWVSLSTSTISQFLPKVHETDYNLIVWRSLNSDLEHFAIFANKQYSNEIQHRIIKDQLNCISETTDRAWIGWYKHHGAEGYPPLSHSGPPSHTCLNGNFLSQKDAS